MERRQWRASGLTPQQRPWKTGLKKGGTPPMDNGQWMEASTAHCRLPGPGRGK